MGANNSPL